MWVARLFQGTDVKEGESIAGYVVARMAAGELHVNNLAVGKLAAGHRHGSSDQDSCGRNRLMIRALSRCGPETPPLRRSMKLIAYGHAAITTEPGRMR
jgi:hypothetical protein